MTTKTAPAPVVPTALYGGLVTIDPMRCCLCGRGIEAGELIGSRINDMVHGDCLVSFNPFADTVPGDVR